MTECSTTKATTPHTQGLPGLRKAAARSRSASAKPSGGTVHSNEELERVRQMLEEAKA